MLMRKLGKIFMVIWLYGYMVIWQPLFALAKECGQLGVIDDIDKAAEMEDCAEEVMRPHGLEEQKPGGLCRLSGVPIIGDLFIKKMCDFSGDASDVRGYIVPQNIQVPPQPLPEEASSSAYLESAEGARGMVEAKGLGSILDWLIGIIAGFTIKEDKGPHILAAIPQDVEAVKVKEVEMGAMAVLESDIPEGFDTLKRAYTPYALQPEEKAPYIPPPEIIPPEGPTPTLPGKPTLPPGEAAKSLNELFQKAGSWAGMPWSVIKVMAIIEGSSYHVGDDLENINSGVFALSADEIIIYQQPGAKAPINCRPNACSAAGIMQLTTTGCVPFDTCEVKRDDTTNVDCALCSPACKYRPSAWSYYKNAVLEYENDGRTPNVCNLKDAIFAAAKKMKNDSGTAFGVLGEWSRLTVYRVAERYYGACTPCNEAKLGTGAAYACQRLGKTYCEFVWDYYQSRQ